MIMCARAAGRGTVRGAVKAYVTLLALSWWSGLTCVSASAFILSGVTKCEVSDRQEVEPAVRVEPALASKLNRIRHHWCCV